jgi:hypothetical protein
VIIDRCVNQAKSVSLSRGKSYGVVSSSSVSGISHGTIYETIIRLRGSRCPSGNTLKAVENLSQKSFKRGEQSERVQ